VNGTRPGTGLLAALCLGAVGAVSGQEAAAPLEESKRALQQLRKEQGAPAPQATLREAAPVIRAPEIASPGSAGTPPPQLAREKAARQARAQRDWLADGVRSLERDRQGGSRTADGEDAWDGASEEIDPADPDYLLKAYQRREREAQHAGAPERDREQTPPPALADPLEPFLREWLKGSPVEALALGARRPAGPEMPGSDPRRDEASLLPPQLPPATPGGAPGAWSLPGETRSTGENPFLQALAPVALPGGGGAGEARVPGSLPGLEVAVPAAAGPRIAPIPAPPPPVVPRERKPPPSPLQENEKYFPQQRKF